MSILKVGMYASSRTGVKPDPEPADGYITFSSDEPFSIKFNQKSWDGVLEYSTDTQNWYTWDASEINSVDNRLYLKGTDNSYITGEAAIADPVGYAMQINATGDVECSGNIMSLLDHEDVDNAVMGADAFTCLFFEQDKLLTSPELPAMTLAEGCYADMFRGTGIEVAPELPATELADYCYNHMFNGCTNLTVAPELPATTLADYCYSGMFSDCTNLTVAPELPATTLAGYCYHQMFYGCTSLTAAPELPATTLADYCYSGMFLNCTNLTTAPELPATVLTFYCYAFMFQNCTSLTVAPELPATTLAEYCYLQMFTESSIAISSTQTGIYQAPWRIPTVGTGTTATDWNLYMLYDTSGTFTDNPDINTTYYQSN